MSNASHTKHALLALGLAGLLGTLATTNASAGFHFGGGGGGAHFAAPHFSAPHFSAPRVSAPHFAAAPRFGGGGGGRRMSYNGGARRFAAGDHNHSGTYGHGNHGNHGGGGDRHPTHVAHGGSDWSHSRHGHNGFNRFACGRHGHCGGPTYVVNGPTYDGGDGAPDADPVYVGRSESPAPVYSGGPVGPASSAAPVKAPVVNVPPKTCVTGGTFVEVAFQPNVTASAITAFLKEYDVTMADGPNPDGIYRIRISSETIAPDQIGQMIDAMRSKKDVVISIQS